MKSSNTERLKASNNRLFHISWTIGRATTSGGNLTCYNNSRLAETSLLRTTR